MKSSHQHAGRLIAFLAFSLYVSAAGSISLIPPKISDLGGNWIGQSDAGEFARLALKPDGSGILAINFYNKQPIWLYRVKVSKPPKNPLGWELSIHATPIGHKHSLLIKSAEISIHRITFVEAADGFPTTYTLTPELDAMTRYNEMIRNSVMKFCIEKGC